MTNDLIEPMAIPSLPRSRGSGVGDLREAMIAAPATSEVVTLVKEKVTARCSLSPRFVRDIEVHSWLDTAADYLTYALTGWVLKLPNRGELRLPKTWWDGFKIAHFPEWLLSRYPAEYVTYEAEQFVTCDHALPKGMEVTAAVFKIPKEEMG